MYRINTDELNLSIFPEEFIAEKMAGKTMEEALKEIKSLWKEIRRLNKTIDDNWDPHNFNLNLYSMESEVRDNLEYIVAAKKYFEKQGWEYELSREEKNDLKFNDRLELIKSIEIMFRGFLDPGSGKIFYFNGEEVKVKNISSHPLLNKETEKEEIFEGKTKSEILEGLREIHMGMWRDCYPRCPFYDGVMWSIVIKYTDGKKKEYHGEQDYPDNFDDFLKLMGMRDEEDGDEMGDMIDDGTDDVKY